MTYLFVNSTFTNTKYVRKMLVCWVAPQPENSKQYSVAYVQKTASLSISDGSSWYDTRVYHFMRYYLDNPVQRPRSVACYQNLRGSVSSKLQTSLPVFFRSTSTGNNTCI